MAECFPSNDAAVEGLGLVPGIEQQAAVGVDADAGSAHFAVDELDGDRSAGQGTVVGGGRVLKPANCSRPASR